MVRHLLSPLRYPGGKARLASFLARVIDANNLQGGTYVEPFAGGASVALYLLMNGYVSNIHINDKDPAIAAFWHSVIYQADALCDRIETTPITIDEWHKQRAFQKTKDDFAFSLDLAFSTLFLNRTNRSGILWAGPIGGQSQQGAWKLDCRFNKRQLIERIQRIAEYADRIQVTQCDAIELLATYISGCHDSTLIYLDPPYYIKGKGLYLNAYSHEDHLALSQMVANLKAKWIVSYDEVQEIKEMYSIFHSMSYQLNYSVQRHTKGSEVIFWKDLILPEISFSSKSKK